MELLNQKSYQKKLIFCQGLNSYMHKYVLFIKFWKNFFFLNHFAE